MSSLSDYLKRVRDKMRSVRSTADEVGDNNTPSQQQQEDVEKELDAAELDLTQIHDANVSPSLDPPTAGQVQNPTIPASRQQTASDAVNWAEEAYEESLSTSPNPDPDYIGDRTRTIASVYIPAIRDDFGLT